MDTKSQHTTEPWEVPQEKPTSVVAKGSEILSNLKPEDAQRIVDCVNALAGVSDPQSFVLEKIGDIAEFWRSMSSKSSNLRLTIDEKNRTIKLQDEQIEATKRSYNAQKEANKMLLKEIDKLKSQLSHAQDEVTFCREKYRSLTDSLIDKLANSIFVVFPSEIRNILKKF